MREAKERPFQPGLFGGMQAPPIELPPPMPERPIAHSLDVTLDPEEQEDVYRVARTVAARYQRGVDEQGRRARMKWRLDAGVDPVAHFAQSLGAEMAVSVWTGLPWNRGNRRKADVGHNVEARQTRYGDGFLVLKSFDHLERIYVLAVGRFPSYRLVGWIHGSAGVARAVHAFMPGEPFRFRPGGEPRASSNGGWIVPQAALHPMMDLRIVR